MSHDVLLEAENIPRPLNFEAGQPPKESTSIEMLASNVGAELKPPGASRISITLLSSVTRIDSRNSIIVKNIRPVLEPADIVNAFMPTVWSRAVSIEVPMMYQHEGYQAFLVLSRPNQDIFLVCKLPAWRFDREQKTMLRKTQTLLV